jgi:hypothetical protein
MPTETTTGLNIIEKPLWVGLFDHAFGFMHGIQTPTPGDFRTMEDASAVDLDLVFQRVGFLH